ncbi:MAG: pyridoxal phosphate-dependent aminotransferase [Hyphomicrobiaceae bacterium]|nr:pyridoxal phosphate-dependent aminotransferase [Hyphomicrobiaceae bacterium]
MNTAPFTSLADLARKAPESGIVEVMNRGRARGGVLGLWAGEGDLPTPRFIIDAATRSMAAGETFYTWQRGIPELRQALADWHAGLYGTAPDMERFTVTGSGMQAIQIAVEAVSDPGGRILVPTPAWPNLAAAAGLRGAVVEAVPMRFAASGWMLDREALADAAARPGTAAIFVNSPSNPTGWVATREDQEFLLDLARRTGAWIIADEVYGLFVYDEAPSVPSPKGRRRAPSFHDIAEPDDRILFVNTFSKNWAMTGWRIGWIEAPAALGQTMENLVQYSTSGVAVFMQRAAIAALESGEGFLDHQIERTTRARGIIADALEKTGRVRGASPHGGFYAFFALEGEKDSRATALRLIDEAAIGLAPGLAFGAGGEAFLRLCFARDPAQISDAAERLTHWISASL